jgi:acyl carrier protein
LFIGGAGVALGYLNRSELTAQRFVADPFGGGDANANGTAGAGAPAGARLYRTGDRARWCHDGELEHLGRLDFQVKLRGHRIELGEIESVLGAHPAVARAVVIVREDRPGDARLVAYVVARAGRGEAEELLGLLREHVRASLPAYMLPQHVVLIDALPLLPNGKMDRSALPLPRVGPNPARRAGEQLPSTPVEQALASVWQELLGVQQVMRSDNFFDLGGHSLLAMRVVHAMEQRTGLRLELRRLVFESLAQLAAGALAAPTNEGAPQESSEGRFTKALRSVRDLIGG